MKINRPTIITAVAALLLTCLSAQAQNNAGSPYSKFGYGLLNDNASAAQMQMGGVGYAMTSGRQINVKNPASYARIDSLTFLFDMGVDFTIRNSKEGAVGENEPASEHRNGGGLDYITMQFPIGKRFGASVGLLPYSSVGYSFGSKIENGLSSRQGSGGINQLYIGFAGRVIDNFTLGFNVSYLFGNIINDVTTTVEGTGSQALFEQLTRVRDYHFEFGAQYQRDFAIDHNVAVGLVYSPRKSLLGHAEVTKYDINADKEPEEVNYANLKGNAQLPETWGFGAAYTWRKRLTVEADYTYQPWSDVKLVNFDGFQPNRFADRWRMSLGAQYIHNPRGNYLQRIAYRAGGFYSQDYMMVGDNHVREYGVSFGLGLPTVAGKTVINLGFDYRHRQAHPNPMLKENYFNIRLGINFNELWFFKNKIN